MTNHFPVRPRPKIGESVRGFIIRIAKKNGFFSIKDIIILVGLKDSSRYLDTHSSGFEKLVTKLAAALRCLPQEISKPLTTASTFECDDERVVIDVLSKTPKICVECLTQKDAYIRHNWQLMHHTHCEEHLTPLINQCPNCKNAFSWNADLLRCCSGCGFRLSEHSSSSRSALPIYQQVTQSMSEKELLQYLRNLYTASLCAYNPLNLLIEKTSTCPFSVAEADMVFEKAYWLLTSGEARNYSISLINTLAKPLDFIDIKALKELGHPMLTLPQLMLPLSSPMNIHTDILDLCRANTSMLSDSQACKLMGINAGEIKELSIVGLLPQTSVKKTYLYQLKDVDHILGRLHHHAVNLIGKPASTLYPLDKLSKLCHKFLFNFGDTIKLILDEGISFYHSKGSNTLKNIYVEQPTLVDLLKKHELTQFSRLLSTSELRAYFCVQQIKISIMADLFKWEKVYVNRSSFQYNSSSISAFTKDFLLLDKWCDLNLYPRNCLYKYLLNHNFEPIDNPYSHKSKIHIFKKSDALFSIIAQFERDWFQSKYPSELIDKMNIKQPILLSESANQAFALRVKKINS